MNYIVDSLDFTLLQFGPADISCKEISYRQVVSETMREQFWWLLKPSSSLKRNLVSANYMMAFERVPDCPNPDIVGYQSDDKILIIVETPDSHLLVARSGFRYFLVTFRKREIPVKLFVGEHEAEIPKTTE